MSRPPSLPSASAPACASLLAGEAPMPHAPAVTLPSGCAHVPQHYLTYAHTVDTVQAIVAQIGYAEHYPLFVCSDQAGIYLQVGIIGRENYERSAVSRPLKVVYGRKWRIEPQLPSGEIVQTAFLALKKAREHEIRELLTLAEPDSGRISAPFSAHLDLQLMVRHPELLVGLPDAHQRLDAAAVRVLLAQLRFGGRELALVDLLQRPNGALLLDLQLGQPPAERAAERELPEYDELAFSVLLAEPTAPELLYEIMAALLAVSERHVDEHFMYEGVPRFSRRFDPRRIAALSLASRPYQRDRNNPQFAECFAHINQQVDATRVPQLGNGPLDAQVRACLDRHGPLEGQLPLGYGETPSR